MIVEYAQLLSTAHRMLDGTRKLVKEKDKWKWRWVLSDSRQDILLKDTHHEHPSAVWVRECSSNYYWLRNLFLDLLEEYSFRYGKTHKYKSLAEHLCPLPNRILVKTLCSPPSLAMPDEYKTEDAVESYREYYRKGKTELLQYKNREIPTWILGSIPHKELT